MSERTPYTRASVSIDEDGTRIDLAFYTPDLSVMALGVGRERPFLNLSSREAQVMISTTGGGPVTEQDVILARQIADAAARYLADCERLRTDQAATPVLPGLDEVAA
ncbi:hypothetical protein [Streptosporangium sp. NPDC000509]|uniref:hypothetical protein n=1 Tax=Streptosporangium sp. NPDC000509 TaxID=3366186 RepID=UPI0036931BE6